MTRLFNERQSDTLWFFAYAIMKSIDGTSYALLLLGHGTNGKVYLGTPSAYSQWSLNSTIFDCLSEIVARRTELRVKSVEGMAGELSKHREELCKVGGKECTGPNFVRKMLTVIACLMEVILGTGVCENGLSRLPLVTVMGFHPRWCKSYIGFNWYAPQETGADAQWWQSEFCERWAVF